MHSERTSRLQCLISQDNIIGDIIFPICHNDSCKVFSRVKCSSFAKYPVIFKFLQHLNYEIQYIFHEMVVSVILRMRELANSFASFLLFPMLTSLCTVCLIFFSRTHRKIIQWLWRWWFVALVGGAMASELEPRLKQINYTQKKQLKNMKILSNMWHFNKIY